jgi:uncharacterized protein (TIGR02001 family)
MLYHLFCEDAIMSLKQNKGVNMTMKKLSISLVAASLLSTAAYAEEFKSVVPGLSASANVALTTDYIWRGASQTNNNSSAVQGGFDLEHESGAYLGTWGSTYAAGNEHDFYAGYGMEVAGVGLDLGAIYYYYPEAKSGNGEELYLGVSYSVAGVDLGLTESYSVSGSANNIEGSIGYDAGVANVGVAVGYNSDMYAQVHVGIPCVVTGGEWGVDYGYTSSASAYAISHGFSF